MRLLAVWTMLGVGMVAWAGTALADDRPKAAPIQCWKDKDGHRMCGDNVPQEYVGEKRDVIKDGRVIDTVKAAKTPEEIAEAKRQKKAADDAAIQERYDTQLLQTYRSSSDIETMRDERVALIDSRTRAIEKNSADTDRTLEDLRARVAAQQKDNKPVDERLAKQVRQFERAQKQNQNALVRYKAEREDVLTKFNGDLARFKELQAAAKAAKAAAAAKKPGG